LKDSFATAFPIAFPILFVGVWLFVSILIGLGSGWFALAKRYPNRDEPVLLSLDGQSGVMGPWGLGLNHILTLGACRSGLRVEVWRIFAPFCRAFFVPWPEIGVRPTQIFLRPYARLGFGRPEAGVLSVNRRTWERLAGAASQAAGSAVAETLPPLPPGQLRRIYVLEWLAITAIATTFFYLAPRLARPGGAHFPLTVCIAFPAIVFGVITLIRYVAQLPPPT